MSEKKWALPSGALLYIIAPCWPYLRPFGPICALLALFALGRHMGVPTYFFRSFDIVDDFTKHIKKSTPDTLYEAEMM